jgi:hypothetical protein
MLGLLIESNRDLAAFYYLAAMAGVAFGLLVGLAVWWHHDSVVRELRDEVRSELGALAAADRLTAAAWQARTELHDAARSATQPRD